jgi:hypothetical protein
VLEEYSFEVTIGKNARRSRRSGKVARRSRTKLFVPSSRASAISSRGDWCTSGIGSTRRLSRLALHNFARLAAYVNSRRRPTICGKNPKLNQENHLVPPRPLFSQSSPKSRPGEGLPDCGGLRIGIAHKRPSDRWASAPEEMIVAFFRSRQTFTAKSTSSQKSARIRMLPIKQVVISVLSCVVIIQSDLSAPSCKTRNTFSRPETAAPNPFSLFALHTPHTSVYAKRPLKRNRISRIQTIGKTTEGRLPKSEAQAKVPMIGSDRQCASPRENPRCATCRHPAILTSHKSPLTSHQTCSRT